MNIDDLYNKLDKIFAEYTTHQWKNGWPNEGDRLSKELSIQKHQPGHNLFLLHKYTDGFELCDSNSFKVKLKYDNTNPVGEIIRVDIEDKNSGVDLFYFIDNELDWIDNQEFIVELCQNIYNSKVLYYNSISKVPRAIYGEFNPDFFKLYRRDKKLKDLGI